MTESEEEAKKLKAEEEARMLRQQEQERQDREQRELQQQELERRRRAELEKMNSDDLAGKKSKHKKPADKRLPLSKDDLIIEKYPSKQSTIGADDGPPKDNEYINHPQYPIRYPKSKNDQLSKQSRPPDEFKMNAKAATYDRSNGDDGKTLLKPYRVNRRRESRHGESSSDWEADLDQYSSSGGSRGGSSRSHMLNHIVRDVANKLPKFAGDHYSRWAREAKRVLHLTRGEEMIKRDYANTDDPNMYEHDQLVAAYLESHISEEIKNELTITSGSAYDVWHAVKRWYDDKDGADLDKTFSQLRSLKLDGDIESYKAQFIGILKALDRFDVKVPAEFLTFSFLEGLGEQGACYRREYAKRSGLDPRTVCLEVCRSFEEPKKEIFISHVKKTFRPRDGKAEQQVTDEEEHIYFGRQPPDRPDVTCWKCGEEGHVFRDCPELKGSINLIVRPKNMNIVGGDRKQKVISQETEADPISNERGQPSDLKNGKDGQKPKSSMSLQTEREQSANEDQLRKSSLPSDERECNLNVERCREAASQHGMRQEINVKEITRSSKVVSREMTTTMRGQSLKSSDQKVAEYEDEPIRQSAELALVRPVQESKPQPNGGELEQTRQTDVDEQVGRRVVLNSEAEEDAEGEPVRTRIDPQFRRLREQDDRESRELKEGVEQDLIKALKIDHDDADETSGDAQKESRRETDQFRKIRSRPERMRSTKLHEEHEHEQQLDSVQSTGANEVRPPVGEDGQTEDEKGKSQSVGSICTSRPVKIDIERRRTSDERST